MVALWITVWFFFLPFDLNVPLLLPWLISNVLLFPPLIILMLADHINFVWKLLLRMFLLKHNCLISMLEVSYGSKVLTCKRKPICLSQKTSLGFPLVCRHWAKGSKKLCLLHQSQFELASPQQGEEKNPVQGIVIVRANLLN